MRNHQLKESLLGWGGYEDVQEKIYLENQVVYCRGNRQPSVIEIRGAFHKWSTTISGTTYYVYTESLTPKLGDPVFIESDSAQTPGRVLKYAEGDIITEHILIYLGNDWPITLTSMFYYEEAVADKTFRVNVSSENIYPINIDGTQNNKKFIIQIDYNDTVANEKWFFDKATQCLIRTAFQEYMVDTYASSGIGTLKQFIWDAFDPNTGNNLDHHVIWGRSNQSISTNCRKENVLQGFYSFYCNGIARKATSTDDGFEHTPTLFVYSPHHRKVFSIPVGDVLPIENPIGTSMAITKDAFFEIFNMSNDLTKLDDILAFFYTPHYLDDTNGNVDYKLYKLNISLETNPYSMIPEVRPSYMNEKGLFSYTYELYPNFTNYLSGSLFTKTSGTSDYYQAKFAYGYQKNPNTYVWEYDWKYTTIPSIQGEYVNKIKTLIGANFSWVYPFVSGTNWTGNINKLIGSGSSTYKTSMYSNIEVASTSNMFPQLFSGPKYINTITTVNDAGNICSTDSAPNITYFKKTYSDECYSVIVVSDNLTSCFLIGTTQNSVAATTVVGQNEYNRTIHNIDIDGTTWYYTNYPDNSGTTITPIAQINHLYIEGPADSNESEVVVAIKSIDNLSYTPSIIIKDFYNNNTGNLVYKILSRQHVDTIPTVDSTNNTATSYVYQPQSEIPISETHMILTSTPSSSVSASSLPRYISLISTTQDNTNVFMTYQSQILDCNTNINYLADNTLTGSGMIGGFAIPPVAIGDGEIASIDTTKDLHYYAWIREGSSSSPMYIYTNSMDSAEVVDKAYFYKDSTNNFYRENLSNNSKITSITSSYLTLQNGVQYLRLSSDDWDLEISTNIYVPSYLNAWGA